MAVRIEKIKINRGGPLKEDFILEPADVNLIFGHNETGKTYIVESIIRMLFGAGKKPADLWKLRNWNCSGNITISGLDKENVKFTVTGKKLGDYWSEEAGLPQNIGKLLVIKAGETYLTSDSDGVGRDILKNYLSGEGLLDKIEGRISKTIRDSYVSDCWVHGPNRGEIRDLDSYYDELEKLDGFIKEVDEKYYTGDIYRITKDLSVAEEALENMERAKKYRAGFVTEEIKKIEVGIEELPDESDISKIEADIAVYRIKEQDIKNKKARLSEQERYTGDYQWAEKALSVYKEIMGSSARTGIAALYMFLLAVSLIGAIATGFLDLSIIPGASAAAAFIFLLLYYYESSKAIKAAGTTTELSRLRTEFSKRFGLELSDIAQLEAKVGELRAKHQNNETTRNELDSSLVPDLNMRRRYIQEKLFNFEGRTIPPEEWQSSVSELRVRLKKLTNEETSLGEELAALNVKKEDRLYEKPLIEWDAEKYETLLQQYKQKNQKLEDELEQIDKLKDRLKYLTDSEDDEWENLIVRLRDKRKEAAQDYACFAAEILGKIHVFKTIKEFREEENSRITRGLESDDIINPLKAITGYYKMVRHDPDGGLIVTSLEDEEYPLSEISTGAQEQIHIALRMGFSSIAMGSKTAFLILDDAFQHSDWPRRENLIDQMMRLFDSEWQIFYFAMDDHIRDLFTAAGKRIGKRFKKIKLN